ncbi:MAG TPA: 2-C-methyl-D-erythritol 4-phosphate cytidylyltransferase [Thermoanaerobaculia bacterium]
MSIAVLIPAAGSGTRFGGEIPKQFLPLAGRPLLLHTVERFLLDENVARVVVAVAEPLLASVKQTPGDRVSFVAGGATRQQSVMRALEAAGEDVEIIAVHDAVRPFFRTSTFAAIVALAREHGAALPAVPLTDTIHMVGDDFTIQQTLDRSVLAAAQTPQVFRAPILRDILDRAMREGIEGTDEVSLAVRYGYTVKVVVGDRTNIKITNAEDMEIAESWLKETAE